MSKEKFSPTELSTLAECEGKWGYKYLLKLPTPQKGSAKVGSRVHKILEHYLEDGTPPDRNETLKIDGKTYYPGRIAFAIAKKLPPAGSCKGMTEKTFEYEYNGIRYFGYIDLRRKNKVNDHKTTSDLKYAKTPKELHEDPQAIIYIGEALSPEGEEANETGTAEWIYGKTKGDPATRVVTITLTEEEWSDAMAEHVEPLAKRALELYEANEKRPIDPSTLNLNFNSCSKFGGCPFQEQCKPSPEKKIRSIMSKREELLKRLEERRKLAKKTDATPETLNTESDAEGPAPPDPKGLDKLKGAVAPVEGAPKKRGRKPKVIASAGPNPPEAEESPRPVVKEPESEKEPELIETKVTARPQKTNAPQSQGFTLYVDCLPTKANRIFLHELISAACAQVQEEMNVPHWSLVDYGKGAGCLAVQLRENLEAAPLPEGTALCMSMWAPEGKAVFQTLSEMAKEVVVGV